VPVHRKDLDFQRHIPWFILCSIEKSR
jgi:hypothetical protein